MRARVEYSGGWDEGGVDAVVLIDDDQNEHLINYQSDYGLETTDDGRFIRVQYLLSPEQQRANALYNRFASVVYDRYGNFADISEVHGFAYCTIQDNGAMEVTWEE